MTVVFIDGRMQVLDDTGNLHEEYYKIKRHLQDQLIEDMYRRNDSEEYTG